MGKLLSIAETGLLLGVLCAPAQAGTLLLDPSTLFIGSGQGTPCATGGCPLINGELNNFGPTTLDIYQNQGGASGLQNPILLILGVPNNSKAPSAASAKLYTPATASMPSGTTSVAVTPGATQFVDPIVTSSTGFATLFGPSNGGDVYDALGIPQNTNSSNSYTNWAGADKIDLGVTFGDFGIYVFELNLSPQYTFTGKDLLNVTLSNVAEGTFAVAYGQDSQHFYDTPFTEAGLDDVAPPPPLPEPSTIAIFGGGIVALGLILRRRNRRHYRTLASQL